MRRGAEVTLNGVRYVIANDQYRRATINPVRPQQATATQAGEGTLAVTGLWRRSQFDFTGGAGQEDYDLASSVPTRYMRSVGINPWVKGKITPHLQVSARHTTADTHAIAQALSKVFFLGGRIVWALDNGVRTSGTSNLTTPTMTTSAYTGTLNDACTDGTNLYYVYATGGGFANNGTGPWTKQDWTSGPSTGVWSMCAHAGGRLWLGGNPSGADAGKLVYSNNGAIVGPTTTTMYTHPASSNFRWTGVVPAAKGFFAFGVVSPSGMKSQSRGEVYYIGIDANGAPSGITLVASFEKEAPYCMVTVGSIAFIGTSKGFRCANFDASGNFQSGPLIQFAGRGVDRPVRCAQVDGNQVVFAWGDMTDSTGTAVAWGVGRADLANMVATLQPAYAPAECTALGAGATGTRGVYGLCLIYGQPFFTDYGLDAIPFAYEDAYPPSGSRDPAPSSGNSVFVLYGVDASRSVPTGAFIETSYFTWGVTDPKTPAQLDLALASPLASGSLSTSILADDTVVSNGIIQTVGSRGSGGPALVASGARISCRRVAVRITWTNSGAVVQSVALFANIAPIRVEQIDVPLAIGPEVETRNGGSIAMTPLTVIRSLKALESLGTIVPYVEGDSSYNVRVDSVELSDVTYDDRSNWWQGVAKVTLITVDGSGAVWAPAADPIPPTP